MPIDPNIAMGVRPVEQPNVLGQMAQVMAMRQAQQEYENEGGLRNALTGGLPDDPSSLLKYGKSGRAIYESALKGKKEQLESSQKRIDMIGGLAGFVRERPTFENFESTLTQSVNYGLMTEAQKQADLAKYGGSPESIKAYADQKFQGALTAKDRTANETRIQAANIGAAAPNRQASIAEQRFGIEQKQQAQIDALYPSTTTPATPMTFGGGGGGGSSIMNPPQTNVLIQGSTPALSPNMLRPDAQAPATAPMSAPVNAPGDVYDQIKALDAQIARLPLNNPRSIPMLTALNQQRTQLLASAKQQYGGPMTSVEVTDPTTGQPTLIQMRPDERGVLRPVKQGDVPLSVDATAGSNLTIDPSVARPAPSATVLKERQATQKLPEAIAMNNDAIRKIDEMIGGVDANGKPLAGAKGKPHPGFGEAVGAGFGTSMIPGTQGKSFTIRHKEVLSQAFLDAFEALKGGGAITEKEGEKATAARTRMDLAQSEKEYMAAAREYQGVLKRGVENAKARIQRSGGTVPTTATPETSAAPVIKSEAEYNALPSGATYIDPDGVSRRKR